MKKEISQIDVGSTALMYGAILASIGLIIGILILLFGSLFWAFIPGMGNHETGLIFGSGIAMVLFLPIMYGLLGVVFGALFAVLYNFLAGRIGGIKVVVKE